MKKRSLVIWMAWRHFADYYGHKLADAIADEYETTITYRGLGAEFAQWDVVMPFYPHRHPAQCPPERVVKRWAAMFEVKRHKLGAVNIANCSLLWDQLVKRDAQALLVPWAADEADFHAEPFPPSDVLRVGWAGSHLNPIKNFAKVKETMESIPGVEFVPACYSTPHGGMMKADYPTHAMGDYYANIHVLVCGSGQEGNGFPLLEASACGRPIVTFDVGIARDLKATGAGVTIIDMRDWDAMGRAVVDVDYEHDGAASAEAVQQHWRWAQVRGRWLEALDGAG